MSKDVADVSTLQTFFVVAGIQWWLGFASNSIITLNNSKTFTAKYYNVT